MCVPQLIRLVYVCSFFFSSEFVYYSFELVLGDKYYTYLTLIYCIEFIGIKIVLFATASCYFPQNWMLKTVKWSYNSVLKSLQYWASHIDLRNTKLINRN